MIRFDRVSLGGHSEFTGHVAAGAVTAIVARSAEQASDMVAMLCGLWAPAHGKVDLFGTDIYSVAPREVLAMLSRVGIVRQTRGILSNLTVLDNVLLPLRYHGIAADLPDRAAISELFRQTGVSARQTSAFLERQAGTLASEDKTRVSLVRSMLMNPELMVYKSVFDGVDEDLAIPWQDMAVAFHHKQAGRASLFITENKYSLEGIDVDVLITPQERN